MKKLSLLVILFGFLLTAFDSNAIVIDGAVNCNPDQVYVYSILGVYDLNLDAPYWSIRGGEFVNGWFGSNVRVRWFNGVTNGTISVKVKVNGETVYKDKPVFINLVEPTVTNLNISTSGEFKTYNDIQLKLNYTSNAASHLSPIVTWTINNAGKVQTLTGNPLGVTFANVGSTTITAKLKYSGFSKEHTSSRTINIVNGATLDPVLTGISGPEKLYQGQFGNYQTIPFTPNLPYLKYVWEVGYDEVGATNAPTFSYTFNESGMIHLYCRVTNTNTGRSGTASKVVQVVGLRSKMIANEQFTILNLPAALIVTDTESSEAFRMIKANRIVDYQLDELLTGMPALKGKIEIGSSIDTGNLPKGIYVMTLKDGNHIETHKLVIK